MVSFVKEKGASLSARWKEASFFKKFVLVNIIIPWTPIIMLAIAVLAPPEVIDLVNENGKLVGQVAGESWKLAAHFFAKSVWPY